SDLTFEFFGQITKEDLADIPHDLRGGDDDRDTAHNRHQPLRLPDSHEEGKLGDKAGEHRHTHRDQADDDEAYQGERHNLADATQFGNLTRVRPVVDHVDYSEEEGCHRPVRNHLKALAKQPVAVEHKKYEHDESHVRNGREAN